MLVNGAKISCVVRALLIRLVRFLSLAKNVCPDFPSEVWTVLGQIVAICRKPELSIRVFMNMKFSGRNFIFLLRVVNEVIL